MDCIWESLHQTLLSVVIVKLFLGQWIFLHLIWKVSPSQGSYHYSTSTFFEDGVLCVMVSKYQMPHWGVSVSVHLMKAQFSLLGISLSFSLFQTLSSGISCSAFFVFIQTYADVYKFAFSVVLFIIKMSSLLLGIVLLVFTLTVDIYIFSSKVFTIYLLKYGLCF